MKNISHITKQKLKEDVSSCFASAFLYLIFFHNQVQWEAISKTSGEQLPVNPESKLISASATQYPSEWKGLSPHSVI